MVTSTRSESHENADFVDCPKMKSKSYSLKMKQNDSAELFGDSFHEIYSQNAPQSPPDPTNYIVPRIFQDFL